MEIGLGSRLEGILGEVDGIGYWDCTAGFLINSAHDSHCHAGFRIFLGFHCNSFVTFTND